MNLVGYNGITKDIINSFSINNIVVIIAGSGTGKSSLAKNIINTLDLEPRIINCCEEVVMENIHQFFKKLENQFDVVSLMMNCKKRFGVIIDDIDLLDKIHVAELFKYIVRPEFKENKFVLTCHSIFLKKAKKITNNIFYLPRLSEKDLKLIVKEMKVKVKPPILKRIIEGYDYDIAQFIHNIRLNDTLSNKDNFIDLNFYDTCKAIFENKLTFEEKDYIAKINEPLLVKNMLNENIIDYLQVNFKKHEIDIIIEEFYKLLIDINKYNDDELGVFLLINYINDIFSKIENVKTIDNNFTNIYTQLSIENSTDLIMNRLSERYSSNIHYLLLLRELIIQGAGNLDPEIFNCGVEFEDIQALVYINKTKEDNLKKIYTNKNFKKRISEFLQSISTGIISSNISESNDSSE